MSDKNANLNTLNTNPTINTNTNSENNNSKESTTTNYNKNISNDNIDILKKIEDQINFLNNKFDVSNKIISEEDKEKKNFLLTSHIFSTNANNNPEIQQNLQEEKYIN